VAIAASAGGVGALIDLVGQLPPDFVGSVVIVQHRSPTSESLLEQILQRRTALRVRTAAAGDAIDPGVIYLARPDLHLTIGPKRRFEYVDGTRIRGVRSSANPLLETAAPIFRDRLIAVVLTGSGTDGTDGVQTVKAHGGFVLAQDEATSVMFGMPRSAIRAGVVDRVLPLPAIVPAVLSIVNATPEAARLEQT
jgi:two-component system chemotaxis response regulator CheB